MALAAVQAHARGELANKDSDDGIALAAEVWECVLQSLARTRRKRPVTTVCTTSQAHEIIT
jgi:hypothetical protein